MHHLTTSTESTLALELGHHIAIASDRVAPLWPLDRFVAVNPFLGFVDHEFCDAAREVRKGAHADLFMQPDYYLAAYREGRILDADLQQALVQKIETLRDKLGAEVNQWNVEMLIQGLEEANAEDPLPVRSFAEVLDLVRPSEGWGLFAQEEVAKHCATRFDRGQALWGSPFHGETLYSGWQQAASLDARPELAGLKGFRQWVEDLSRDPYLVIREGLLEMQLPEALVQDYLYRLLMTVPGWAGFLRFRAWEGEATGHDELQQLMAIRLFHDLALWRKFGADAQVQTTWQDACAASLEAEPTRVWWIRFLWQEAAECAFQRGMIAKFIPAPEATPDKSRASAQAVFCIDVRSEPFRRALESVDSTIETIGFAGFFGMPIAVNEARQGEGSARVPVLLKPAYEVQSTPACGCEHAETVEGWRKVWKKFQGSAVGCFSFVEAIGLQYAWKLLSESLGWAEVKKAPVSSLDLDAIPVNARPQLAMNALKGMGLTSDFAPLVLLCGHGAETRNNPHGSSLDCGACGGHAGAPNARVAAALLNDPQVRETLAKEGIAIPADTWFLAGLHNTTTDEVTLFDEAVPETHRKAVGQWRKQLSEAGVRCRKSRAASLGLSADLPGLDLAVLDRSRNWSEVRPEWGLANNAMFIAAPREKIRHLDLEGRAFLHQYDPQHDPEHGILTLIMTAPMVVANWINLQYYGSSVDNAILGSGTKTTHNLCGQFGVQQGNGGDLQVGLPWQSVHNGRQLAHEPLRLNVVIMTSIDAINGVLKKHANVRQLLDHGWLHLFTMDANGEIAAHYQGDYTWSPVRRS